MQITPEFIELVKAVFYGIAGLCIPLATVYIMITAHRTKELNTKIDGMLVDRDAANVRKGERRGEDKADILAEGQRQGRETALGGIARGLDNSGKPVPVEDEAAAKISRDIAKSTAESADATNAINKRVAEATERAADAQEKIAEEKK